MLQNPEERFSDYRTLLEYHLSDTSMVRVSRALRGIAWDEGDGKYLVSGAHTRIEVRDNEKEGGLDLRVITFLDKPEISVKNTLDRLGATLKKELPKKD